MALPERKNLDLGPITIAYREKGTATPLVFIHGMGGNSAAWEGQYSAFADRYRVIGWDGPGYGDSGEFADDRPVVADYVDALARLFDTLEIEAGISPAIRSAASSSPPSTAATAIACATWR